MVLFSVIIPIYKVEKYLHECVDSILNQSYKNIEVILVDDGSPDRCPEICDAYSKRDSRVKVIHQSNAGLSEARNVGLKIAIGEYILFLDSDDFHVNCDFLKNNAKLIEEKYVDIILFKRTYCNEEGQLIRHLPLFDDDLCKMKNIENMLIKLLASDELECSAPMKIIKKQILIDNKLYFKLGILSEDVEWFLRLIPYIKIVGIDNSYSYYYRVRQGSITNSISEKNISDLTKTILDTCEIWKNSEDSKVRQAILGYACYQYYILLGLVNKLDRETRKKYMNIYKKLYWISDYSISQKTKISKLIVKLFGINVGSKCLGKYIRIKNNACINFIKNCLGQWK